MSATPPSDNNDRTVIGPARASAPVPSSGNTLPPGTRLGEFEITGLIGEGGFGIVYLADDHSLQRKVALKEYMPSALAARSGAVTVSVKSDRHAETFAAGLKSFVNEARLLAQFDHPSLVKVYRFWEANGTAYMVMPFYEGMTLKEALRKMANPPDEAWLKDLLRPLLDALDQIHRENCFHRDIAPDNILLLKDGRPLLLDFGAARRVIGDMTHALTVILKPGYAPVEQYAEMPDMKQGAWTDIYALASVMYFAITGKTPVPSVARMMSDPMEPLSKIAAGRYSEEFLQGIDKALAVRPDDRPQNTNALRSLWGLGERRQRSRGQSSTHTETGTEADASHASRPKAAAVSTASPPVEKNRLPLFAGAGLLLIALIAGGWFFSRGTKPPENVTAKVESTNVAPAVTAPVAPTVAPPAPETVAPPLPQAADKPFEPALMLDEIFEGRNRAHAVTASVERAQVRIGKDNLRFNISSSKSGYVYVFVVGTNKSDFYLLYPNGVDKNNQIKPGQTLKLPSASWPMKAQGPAGTNQFVAIVSDEPRDFSGLNPQPEDIFKKFPLDIGAKLYREYTGSIPLFTGKTVCTSENQCSNAYGAAIFSIEEVANQPEARAPPTTPTVVKPRTSKPLATVTSPPKATPKPDRCSDILQRASLGEPLTVDEQTTLRRDCK